MPNCRLETSRRIAAATPVQALFADLHALLVEKAAANMGDCKSRVVVADEVVVGDGSPALDMVHLEIGLLPGRSAETKSAVGEAALGVLRRHLSAAVEGLTVQFTVQIKEMPRETYFKAIAG